MATNAGVKPGGRRGFYDIAALIARIVVGIVFVAHGWQKVAGGHAAVAEMFSAAGIPLSGFAAAITMIIELIGGVLLILGLLTPLVGVLLFLVMLAAFVFVHARNGVFVQDNGFELVGALGSAALLLAAGGAGRISLDHLIFGRKAERRRAEQEAVPYTPPTATQPAEPPPAARPAERRPYEEAEPGAEHAEGEEEPRVVPPPSATPGERTADHEPPSRWENGEPPRGGESGSGTR
ncbi:DoxX family protein [Sinosporangium siamense]|uniref:Oxidoreductase n=1 Tax=Sinosporangium siamense TaxID=1367973 RepID=A0A919RNX4_9ACTN|nr:DoxX family protein [Sinosporangium siamense]GII97236.1 hypothetical protein Ssi02_74670 [Sinosporangium siamense]